MPTNTIRVFMEDCPEREGQLVAYCVGDKATYGDRNSLYIDGGDASQPDLFDARVERLCKMFFGIQVELFICDLWTEDELEEEELSDVMQAKIKANG